MIPRRLTLAIAGLWLGCWCAPAAARAESPRPVLSTPRTVLTIHWGSERFPGTDTIDAGIRKVLLDPPEAPVNYFTEHLESEELTPEIAETALRDYIHGKYDSRPIDLVITNGSAALQFALGYRDELFPRVPIVFMTGGTLPRVLADHAGGITGVVRDTSFAETVQLALKLHPSATRVFVVGESSLVEGYDEQVRSALSSFTSRAEFTYIRERTVPALLAAVKAIPPGSVLFYTRYTSNENGRMMYPDEVLRLLARVAPVPIYSAGDVYLGTGIVGGAVRSGDAAGVRAGEMARDILAGAAPETIPIERLPMAPTFDWRQLQRWGIDSSTLPAGSKVLFRTPTAWETYRQYILGTIVVVIGQLLLIAGLLTQRARLRRAEAMIRAREVSLRTSYDRICQLTGRLINAQEAARASIAQDLHDDVCQRLAMVSIGVENLRNSSGDIRAPAAQRAFTDLSSETRGTFDSLRRLSHELHPATLRVLGLAPALKAHCVEVERVHNVQIAFAAEDGLRDLRPEVAISLFRIAQESLRNGIVHGGARRFAVSLTNCGDNQVEMAVTDDGRGFDLEAVRQAGIGLGLVSIEERAHVVGGMVHILTGVRQGTTIRVTGPAERGGTADADVRPRISAERSTAIA